MASEALSRLIAQVRVNPYHPGKTIAELRGTGPDGGFIPRPNTEVTAVEANGVACEWVTWGTAPISGVFMFLHGGGYYRSSGPASRRVASYLSTECGCRCFTVDYRLAPEHPFPAAIDDAYQAYQWLLHHGTNPEQIVVGGSSAGGGLSAALLNKLKSLNEPLPAAAVLMSPWTDLTQSAPTFSSNGAFDPAISKAYLDRAAAQYLHGEDAHHPLASPVYGELAGLPPTLIQVGNLETMFGDAQAYHEKACAAGVDCRLEAFDDVIHGWHNSEHRVPDIPETQQAMANIGRFVRAQLGPGPGGQPKPSN